uniref:Uncharacterized protein n=1 Tax=Macaca fascicularis TaxID=9541 RepID=A0A7N9CD87_MACFA
MSIYLIVTFAIDINGNLLIVISHERKEQLKNARGWNSQTWKQPRCPSIERSSIVLIICLY